jgi:hypothetical protein
MSKRIREDVEFLAEVGNELDRVNARIEHRRAWADLMKQA